MTRNLRNCGEPDVAPNRFKLKATIAVVMAAFTLFHASSGGAGTLNDKSCLGIANPGVSTQHLEAVCAEVVQDNLIEVITRLNRNGSVSFLAHAVACDDFSWIMFATSSAPNFAETRFMAVMEEFEPDSVEAQYGKMICEVML